MTTRATSATSAVTRSVRRSRDDVASYFATLRAREYARLDAAGHAYLDYTGSSLYSKRQLRAHYRFLERALLGNPHSAHSASRASTALIEDARATVLAFLDADPAEYAVCFTANTSAALKLVGESYAFEARDRLVLSADNHNSVNGIREYARSAGAEVSYLPLDVELRLDAPASALAAHRGAGRAMFAFPAQSNLSGVKHPLALIRVARSLGYDVLLDAAAFVPTSMLSLRATPADFVALSFYKIFGLPTGVGALIARRDALARLRRPWFSGGTVEYVSVQHRAHLLRAHAEGFEDGTPNFLGIGALRDGFALMREIGLDRLNAHVTRLTAQLLEELRSARYANGSPRVRIYGPPDLRDRGATVAFNVLDRSGRAIPYWNVEERARSAGVSVRGGCFCNPGASEIAFGFPAGTARECQLAGERDGFSIQRFAECLARSGNDDVAIGALRASFGTASNADDVRRLMAVVRDV